MPTASPRFRAGFVLIAVLALLLGCWQPPDAARARARVVAGMAPNDQDPVRSQLSDQALDEGVKAACTSDPQHAACKLPKEQWGSVGRTISDDATQLLNDPEFTAESVKAREVFLKYGAKRAAPNFSKLIDVGFKKVLPGVQTVLDREGEISAATGVLAAGVGQQKFPIKEVVSAAVGLIPVVGDIKGLVDDVTALTNPSDVVGFVGGVIGVVGTAVSVVFPPAAIVVSAVKLAFNIAVAIFTSLFGFGGPPPKTYDTVDAFVKDGGTVAIGEDEVTVDVSKDPGEPCAYGNEKESPGVDYPSFTYDVGHPNENSQVGGYEMPVRIEPVMAETPFAGRIDAWLTNGPNGAVPYHCDAPWSSFTLNLPFVFQGKGIAHNAFVLTPPGDMRCTQLGAEETIDGEKHICKNFDVDYTIQAAFSAEFLPADNKKPLSYGKVVPVHYYGTAPYWIPESAPAAKAA
ncbi:hypothetical protein [Streptomyces luteireticuli]|uniref:hypothetical protein n=1 Tax=Streptomyces luteireticuli TaxID=173858 RepID=UPI0035590347